MMLLTFAEVKARQPQEPSTGMQHRFFTDPARRERRREMILQKRGMHRGG